MSREILLARVRAALGHPRLGDGERMRAIAARVASAPRNPIPSRAARAHPDLVADFIVRARDQGSLVHEVADARSVPEAIVRIIGNSNKESRIRMGTDPFFDGLPWEEAQGVARSAGAAAPDDRVTLSHALAGVAETGTLVLASGADNPATLALLPDRHIVTVCENAIVGAFEDAFDIVRARCGRGVMPRSLMLISGPSRTGDIGGRIVMGAHGPRRLDIILIKNAERIVGGPHPGE